MYICRTETYTKSLPRKFGGGFCVLNQQVTMKTTHFIYITPAVREVVLHAERGFGASLEIPTIDPEQGWSMRPTDEIIEE